jgi:hypothetical protein
MFNLFKGISKNSDFFVRARKYRTDDCRDAGGIAMAGAIAANRSVHRVHEDRPDWRTSTELTPQKVAPAKLLLVSREKYICRGAPKSIDGYSL